MIADLRRNKIVAMIKNETHMTCKDLSHIFNVTPETIRRDLAYLNEKGLLVRTHGGAMAVADELQPAELRRLENLEQKESIARSAASLIADNDAIYLDGGTTTCLMCDSIPKEKNLYVITNSKNCVDSLFDKQNINLVSTGGMFRKKTMVFVGNSAQETLKSFALSKAFISAIAVSPKFGVMDSHEDEAQLNRIAINNAKEVYLLVDSTKFSKIAYINVCSLDKVTAIITDSNIEKDLKKELEDLQINVIIADE